ncbi:MAG: DUF5050 domain-containing protein, partial [Erysipelothrix sp.]|nr:DUF5050 domain-containing protein [Erysipelothrix sp.]
DSGWIYYGDDNTRVALSKVKLDGTENQKLITTMASNVHIARNYIFYYDGQLSVVRRMDLDGSNIMDITGVGDYGQFHVLDDYLYVFDNQTFQWVSMDLDGSNIKVLD